MGRMLAGMWDSTRQVGCWVGCGMLGRMLDATGEVGCWVGCCVGCRLVSDGRDAAWEAGWHQMGKMLVGIRDGAGMQDCARQVGCWAGCGTKPDRQDAG